MEFKVHKTENEIEDICIAYGMCKILEDNNIQYRLKDELSMFVIYTDEFNLEDLEWFGIETDEISSFISSSFKKFEIDNNNVALNNFFEDKNNLVNTFKFYLGEETENFKPKKVKGIFIGTGFYTLGIRGGQDKKAYETLEQKRYLAFLGWVYTVSYCKNKSIETTILLKPKDTDQLIRCFYLTYVDKKTGQIKNLTTLRDNTETEIESQIYLKTLKEYNNLKDNYSEVYFIRQTQAGNKPLANITYSIDVNTLSNCLIDEMLPKITFSNTDKDVKDVTSKFILDIKNYSKLSKVIRVYSKKNQKLSTKSLKELLEMQIERVQEIFGNESLKILGKGLKRLLDNKAGYEVQVALYNVRNTRSLLKAIRLELSVYTKNYQKVLLNSNQLENIINSIKTNKEAEIFADVILGYSKVFFDKKED